MMPNLTIEDDELSTTSASGDRSSPKSRDIRNKSESPIEQMVASDLEQNRRLSQASDFRKNNNFQPSSSSSTTKLNGPEKVTKFRFVVCTLGLISLSMSQMSRMVLNLSITQMVEQPVIVTNVGQNNQNKIMDDGSCPWPEDEFKKELNSGEIDIIEQCSTTPAFGFGELSSTHATVVDDGTNDDENLDSLGDFTDILDEEDHTTTTIPHISRDNVTNRPTDELETQIIDSKHAERFKWDIKQQNILLGGFYYSYFVFMVFGGRMAEIYGAKYVLLLGVAGSAIINLATPWMARTSFIMLVMSRVLMGAIQSGVFPGMYALISKWLTMSEASIYTPLIKMNLRLGMVLGSVVPGLVDSWPNVFYLTGALNAIWSILWIVVAKSSPAESSLVSPGELKRIQRKKRLPLANVDGDKTTKVTKSKKKTPWLKIISAPSVIGLIFVKLTFNYALDFLAIELPSYLKYVHHATKEKISAITSLMFSIQVFLIVFVGWLAKVMVQRRPFGMSKTAIRKLFQATASLGIAISLFAMTFNDCNIVYVTVLLQLVSLLSMFTAGGETMLPYDLSEEYPATIMAIANSIANVSAITTTTLTGLILGDQSGSYDRWNLLIYIIVGANLFGGTMFLCLVEAEPIESLDEITDKSNKKNQSNRSTNAADRSHVNAGFEDIELAPVGNVANSTITSRIGDNELKRDRSSVSSSEPSAPPPPYDSLEP